jgi:uncharacterized membrane protein
MNLNKLVRASIFTAFAIGSGFSLLMVPNVELITVIVFLSGLTLGVRWGVLVGGTAEFIFSVLNPFGSGLVFPPLLISQVVSMILIGAFGGILRSVFFRNEYSSKRITMLAINGFILTFLFDSLTTLSYPLSVGFDFPQTFGIYISGIGFTLLHQISNAIIFPIVIPKVVKHLA